MIDKKIIVVSKKNTPSYNKIMFNKNNIMELSKLKGRNLELLFLIMNELLVFNDNSFEVTLNFKKEVAEKIGMNANGISVNLTYLSKGNVIKKVRTSSYLYNPHLFFYGDKEHESKCQIEWDKAIKLSR